MNISEIPDKSRVIIDTNILLYAIENVSTECVELLRRCAVSEIYGIIPTNVLAEFMHIRMMAEAKESGINPGSNPARKLSEKPEIIRNLKRYHSEIRDLLEIGFKVEPVLLEDHTASLQVQQKYGLLTNDSLIVSLAERLRINKIVTADKAFHRVDGLEIHSPSDV
ncbi:MAG: PIN domain-containing protein [Ignavibacteria bacterium]|nr:PIN domain-containing protein [Ignavibacteria bacterium]